MYGGLNHGRLDVDRLRTVLAGLSLPRFDGGRLVLAVDVSSWLRPDAPCSAERLFCHVYGRAKTASQFIPGRRPRRAFRVEEAPDLPALVISLREQPSARIRRTSSSVFSVTGRG